MNTYTLTVDEFTTLTYTYTAEWFEPQPDCGEPGGWEVSATLIGGGIGMRRFSHNDLLEAMGAEYLPRLREQAEREITEHLKEGMMP